MHLLIYKTQKWRYEGQLKSSNADQDTLMECNRMRFIFCIVPLTFKATVLEKGIIEFKLDVLP